MALRRPFFRVARSRRAFTVSLLQLFCTRYQPGGVSRALPLGAAQRRLGSLMVVGVRGVCSGPWGVWRDGLLTSGTSTSMCA